MLKPKRRLTISAAILAIVLAGFIFSPASAQLSQWRSLNPTRDGTIAGIMGAGLGPDLFSVHIFSPTIGWAVGGTCDIYTLPLGSGGSPCGAFPANKGFALFYDGTKWRQVLLPGGTKTLASVFVVSPNDVWAVGVGATIVHWDGVSWVSVSAPVGVLDLFSVFMLPGGTDGWAVGEGATDNIRWSGIWPGGAWSPGPVQPLLPGAGATMQLRSVSLSSPTFGWIVASGGQIFKWDGAGWTAQLSPVAVPPVDMLSVFAVSGTDAWAVGVGSTIIRWNGASWTGPMVAPTLAPVDYRSIRMVSSTDGWIAGKLNPTSNEGTLLRWNGVSWNIIRSYVIVNLNGLSMLPGGSAGSSVGDAETIVYWNNVQWIAQTSPTAFSLFGLYLIATNDGWAVGAFGNIYRYDGISWRHYETLPSGITLFSVFMRATNDAWAVGFPAGAAFPPTIVRWNGAAWTVVSPAGVATGEALLDVFMLSATEGWAVGTGGLVAPAKPATILKWDGSIWTSVPSGTASVCLGVGIAACALFSVQMLSSTDGWAVGCTTLLCVAPIILRWNGLAWSIFTSPLGIAGLLGIHMLSPTDGWAVGATAVDGQATIIHWDGVQWRRAPGPLTVGGTGLISVRMVSPTDGWAVGAASGPTSLITHWDGSTWNVVATLAVPPSLAVLLRRVFMVSAFDGWIVSDTGLILHYGPQVILGTTTSTLTTFTTTTSTVGSTTAPTSATTGTTATTAPTAVPGFPWESIAAGIITGLATLTLLRVRKRRRA